jgi:hypothetical protein
VTPAVRDSRFQRFLNGVEVLGNALPHPATLFLLLCGVVIGVSGVCHWAGVEVLHPVKGTPVQVVNLLSAEGLNRIILGLLPNFIGFAPLGSVLVCVLGLSVAEHSGLLAAVMRRIVQATSLRVCSPSWWCSAARCRTPRGTWAMCCSCRSARRSFTPPGAIPWPDWRRRSAVFRAASRRTCCSRPRTSSSPG